MAEEANDDDDDERTALVAEVANNPIVCDMIHGL